ncbi:MAG: hypothetical protein R3311_18240, partial [Oceanisphaera sp.]|nr:hypothetical protein [Oceanisphaera sp.]
MAWPTLRIIAFINGIFLLTLAIGMAVPMLTLLLFERPDELNAFLWSSLITFVVGIAMIAQGRPKDVQLRPRDMYLLTVSSWKLDTSSTATVSSGKVSTTAQNGRPRLPNASARRPPASSRWAISSVVVDLPLVPVTAT